jgi:hypothetical protein
MKYVFQTDLNGSHTRNSDGVRGYLRVHPDTVTVEPITALVNPDDLTLLVAPEPELEPEPVPYEIANWRAKAALEIAGLLSAVEAAITALDGPHGIVARNAWASGAPLARNGPTVMALAEQLDLTTAQVDDLFRQADALSV